MTRFMTVWALVAALTGCSERTDVTIDGAEGQDPDVDIRPADTITVDTAGLFCQPDGRTCFSQTNVAICDGLGSGYSAFEDCPEGTICMATTAECLFPFCYPGAQQCADYWHTRRCDDSGSFWQNKTACPEGEFCEKSACIACSPDASECVDEGHERRCAGDGSTWLAPEACALGETCVAGACHFCLPETATCLDEHTSQTCNALGTGFDTYTTCASDQLCIGTQCVDCGLKKSCLSPQVALRECTAAGTSWSEQTVCLPDHFCAQGECLFESCFSDVLLLVDRSGSMSSDWSKVKSSVHDIIEETDFARFALLSFPGDGNCGVADSLEVGWTLGETAPFDSWFEDSGPTGSTPLVGALEKVFTLAPLFFNETGGTLVVLSDGQDTCALGDEEAQLMNFAAALYVNFNVKSYAIGYNLGGSGSQLNAIAANGGSDVIEYIPAGNEAELTEAFNSIVQDVKLCD